MRHPSTLAVSLLAGLLLIVSTAAAENVAIDFKLLGTQNTAALAVKDVVVTGDSGIAPANVYMLNLNGLGTVGGVSDTLVDVSEALHFSFTTLVNDATFNIGIASNLNGNGLVGECKVEAFVGATSLGIISVNNTGLKNVSALFGGVALTKFTVRADGDGVRIDYISYKTLWNSTGNALAGTHGAPTLAGSGYFVPGLNVTVTASQLLENSSAALIIGYSVLNAPFKGGVLVPNADIVIAGLPTGPAGQLVLTSVWPAGVPSGFIFLQQVWVADPAGPKGFAATNGLGGKAP